MAAASDMRGRSEGIPLADALRDYLCTSGLDALLKYPALATAWRKAAGGEMYAHARVFSFRRGVLEVAVDSSAVMSEMEFRRSTLLKKVQAGIKRPFVREIRFLLKTFSEEEEQERRHDAP